MKIKNFTIILALSSIIAILVFYLKLKNINLDNAQNKSETSIAEGFNKNEGNAEKDVDGITDMLKWRFMRLRDPKTNRIPSNIRAKELKFAKNLPSSRVKPLKKLNKTFTNAGWISRGPNNQGGRSKAIAVDVANNNIILAGAAEGGLWRSTDKGQTWTETTDPSFVQNIDCLVQDTRPGKTNIWYYGTGELRANVKVGGKYTGVFPGNGIFKSTDDGQTWNRIESTASNSPSKLVSPFQYVWNIVVDTTVQNQDIIYAACAGGVLKSTNGGGTWNYILKNTNSQGSKGYYTDVEISADGNIFAAGNYKGVIYSSDGINFKDITPSDWPSTVVGRVLLATAPSDKNRLYMLANTQGVGRAGGNNNNMPDPGDYHSLWKYNKSKNKWTNLSNKLPLWRSSQNNFNTQHSYCMILKVKPDDENFVIVGGVELFRTTDGFATQLKYSNKNKIGGYDWTAKGRAPLYPNHHPDQQAGFFLPDNPDVFYNGNDAGLSYTNDITADSVEWNSMNENYITTQFYSVGIDHATPSSPFIVGGMQDIGAYTTNSSSPKSDWNFVNYNGDGTVVAVANGGKYYYTSTQRGHIFRQSPNSNMMDYITPPEATNFSFIAPYILDPANTNVMFLAAGNKIWRNSNLAGIPDSSASPPEDYWTPFTFYTKDLITALGMSKANHNLLYVGTSNGDLYRINSSTNPGTRSIEKLTQANFPRAFLTSIAVDPKNAANVVIAFSNYNVISIFHSLDAGASWTDISGNLEENPDGSGNGPSIRCVDIIPINGNNIYFAGTSIGLFTTTNLNGLQTQWIQQAPKSIGNEIVNSVDGRSVDGEVVAGTFGKGVFSTKFNTLAGTEDKTESPKTFALKQNYPNPFNPSTSIEYNIPKSGMVNLKVYDSIGRLVKTLVSGYQNEGKHKVVLNSASSGMASGVYYYKLQIKDYSRTKKMILLK